MTKLVSDEQRLFVKELGSRDQDNQIGAKDKDIGSGSWIRIMNVDESCSWAPDILAEARIS